jgi:hypothetical protein
MADIKKSLANLIQAALKTTVKAPEKVARMQRQAEKAAEISTTVKGEKVQPTR